MKFFHLSDLHIGRYLNNISLLEDQRGILDQILSYARELSPDFILIAGDIFDRAIPREEAIRVYEDFISKLVLDLKIKVFAIAGNHDSPMRLSGMNNLMKRAGYYIEGEMSLPLKVEKLIVNNKGIEEEVNIVFFPFKDRDSLRAYFSNYYGEKLEGKYPEDDFTNKNSVGANDSLSEEGTSKGKSMENMSDSQVYEMILKDHVKIGGRKILLAHNFFSLSDFKPVTSESERRLNIGGEDLLIVPSLRDFDYIALGHLHRGQKIKEEKIRYSGSIMKYSLSEVDNKITFPFVTLDERGLDLSLLYLKSPRDLKSYTCSYQEAIKRDYINKKDDFIFFYLTDKARVDNAFQKLQILYPNIVGVEYINVDDIRFSSLDREAIENKDSLTLFKDFYLARTGDEISEAEYKIAREVILEVED